MNSKRYKELLKKYMFLKVLIVLVPPIYYGILRIFKKIKRETKIAIIITTAVTVLGYIVIWKEFFETRRELIEMESIILTIEPMKVD